MHTELIHFGIITWFDSRKKLIVNRQEKNKTKKTKKWESIKMHSGACNTLLMQ